MIKLLKIIKTSFNSYRYSYSQAGQDIWVLQAFNEEKNKTFVDVGAFDGVSFSNTFLLEKKYGWRGLCVEANPEVFPKLKRSRRCGCEMSLVGQRGKQKHFLPMEMASAVAKNKTKNTIPIVMESLDRLLGKHDMPSVVDYLSMDIEGSEDDVILNFPFEKYMFRLSTVERISEKAKERMKKYGYILVKELPGLDTFFVHESFSKKYLENILAYFKKNRFLFS